jgi:hypothetical protein
VVLGKPKASRGRHPAGVVGTSIAAPRHQIGRAKRAVAKPVKTVIVQ